MSDVRSAPPSTLGSDPGPEPTAARVALWRALHVELDAPPHVLSDTVGLALLDPPADWRRRGDMDPGRMRSTRASIVGRGRFVEDVVTGELARGVTQYVILGAGVDTFAVRRPDVAERLDVFEVDRPGPQDWKRRRLDALGLTVPDRLRFVPVDFEDGDDWLRRLAEAGFAPGRPTVVGSTGVSMYLTPAANEGLLRRVAGLAPGSTLVLTFLPPDDLLDPADRDGLRAARRGAAAAGTPFLSSYRPADLVELALDAGFRQARHVSHDELAGRYFAGRSDGLRPGGEEILVATTA